MLSRTLPASTTLRSLLEVLLPEDHAANVPRDAGDARVVVRLSGGPSFALDAHGDELTVRETSRVEDAPLLIGVAESTAQLFLDDWLGPKKLAPSFEPRGLGSVTDARFLRRLMAVTGILSLTLDDFEGKPATVLVAAGPNASLYDDPDVEVSLEMKVLLELLAGRLGPDEAIAGGQVAVRGKRLVAIQFALALVPYFPPRAPTRR